MITSALGASASERASGQRSIQSFQYGTTRLICVCWLMTSDTSTPHGVARPKRHGKSRALASHHAPNRKEIAVSFIVLILSSYDERGKTQPPEHTESSQSRNQSRENVRIRLSQVELRAGRAGDRRTRQPHLRGGRDAFRREGRRHRNRNTAPVLLLTAYSRQHRLGHPPVRSDRHDSASGGAAGLQPARHQAAPCGPRLP